MKYKKSGISIAFLFAAAGGVLAQENTVSAGGEVSGSGGIVSYSIGQVVYSTNSGTTGAVAQGLQQPFDISVTNGVDEIGIDLELSVFPNPTANYLTLKTEDHTNLTYQLCDLQGKVVESKKVTANFTSIGMEELPVATYFLQITNKSQLVKTFKIIKL